MSFRKRGAGGRRDIAEPAIVAALNACGVRTFPLSGTGNPDLLCVRRGRYLRRERVFVTGAKGNDKRRTRAGGD